VIDVSSGPPIRAQCVLLGVPWGERGGLAGYGVSEVAAGGGGRTSCL